MKSKDEMCVYNTRIDNTEVNLFIDLNSEICDGENVDHDEIDRLIAITENEVKKGNQPMHLYNTQGFIVGRVQYIS